MAFINTAGRLPPDTGSAPLCRPLRWPRPILFRSHNPDLDQAMVMVARQGRKTVARVSFIDTRVLPSTPIRTRPHPNLPHPAHRQATLRKGVAFYVAPTTLIPPTTTLPQLPAKGRQNHQMAQNRQKD